MQIFELMIPWLYTTLLLIPPVIAILIYLVVTKIYLHDGKRRKILSSTAKVFLSEDVLSTILKQETTGKDAYNKLVAMIEHHVDEFLTVRLIREMPYLSILMGDKSIALMKNIFMRELETLFPDVMNRYMEDAMNQNKLATFAETQVTALTPAQLDSVFNPLNKKLFVFAIASGIIISGVQLLSMILFNNF